MLSKITIRKKILGRFVLVLACTAGLGLFALQRLGAMDHTSTLIRSVALPRTQALDDIAYQTMRYRQLEAEAALAPDPDARRSDEAALAGVGDAASKAFAVHEGLLQQDADRRRAAGMRQAWTGYVEQDGRYFSALHASDVDGAVGLYLGDMQRGFRLFQDQLHAEMAQNAAAAADASRHGSKVHASARNWILGAIGLATVFCMVAGWDLVRNVATPLLAMTSAMRRLAGHDLDTTIPCVGRGDEIGAMAAAVQVFKDNMAEGDRLAAEQQAEQAARQQRSVRLEGLVSEFERQIGSTVATLASASTQMEATASSMTGNAAQTDAQAVAVAQAAAESSAGVQTVAAAAEELAASISEINHQVTSSASLTGRAVGSVRRTDDTVRALSESASRIGQVVELITSIASQTNLLALNATIEAARAGDAGRGFAVVASEVKSLAQQTARATDEIAAQIAQVQQASSGAVEAIREIGGLIEEVGAITGSIAAAVEEQGAATSEIARNVQQTAANTQVVTSNISGVSRAANDTGAAATEVLTAAGDLSRQAENLSAEVSRFIVSIRAA